MTLKRYIIEIFTIVPEIPSSPVDVGKDSKLTTPQGVTGFQEIVVKKIRRIRIQKLSIVKHIEKV